MLVKCSKSCSQKLTIQKFGTGLLLLPFLPSSLFLLTLSYLPAKKHGVWFRRFFFKQPRHQSLHDDHIFL
jgi:hypothetical protein